MRIEVRSGAPLRRRLFRSLFNAPTLVLAASALLLALFLLATGIIVGAYFQETGNERFIHFLTRSSYAQNVVHEGLSWGKALADGENVPLNFAKGVAAASRADELVIDIGHLDYLRLAQKREEALELGVLFSDGSDYVPATVSSGSDSARVQLRLKGDLSDHYETDKWSLRIRVRGDHTLWGMKTFSIQHPQTRNYLGEWLFMEALRREGLIAPRYRFVDVTINGEHKGIYALEEHFERRLVEHAERRDGPILRFDEDLKWRADLADYPMEEYGSFSSSAIEGYAADTSHGSEYERAVAVLEAFRRGELTTSQAFDVEKLAVYVAMRDLCGAPGISWQNFRFYYDPVTSKLEPIAFDNEVNTQESIRMLFCYDGGIMDKREFYDELYRPDDPLKMFFSDLGFFAAYVRTLERISEPGYLDSLLADVGEGLEVELSLLYRDYPHYRWSTSAIRKNQEFIRAALSPPRAIHAYHHLEGGAWVELRLGNIQSVPVEILGLSRGAEAPVPPSAPLVLRSKHRHRPVDYVGARFPPAPEADAAGSAEEPLIVHYRLLGTERVATAPVYPWDYRLDALPGSDWIGAATDLTGFSWIVVDEAGATIRIEPGVHVLERTLVLPAGYTVVAGPGTRLDLRNAATLVSYSPMNWLGSEDSPVVLQSSDGTGYGLVVMEAGAPSVLDHAVFEGLDAPRGNGWSVPGAVTFYESPVDVQDSVFRGIRCEDALNVMRTHFTLKGSLFVDVHSDALDGDFVVGRITGSRFLRCGNDAVDFSGSHVEIEDTHMEDVGDKAVSAGEESEVIARRVRIVGAELAVASKDLSTVSFIDGTISASRVAFCAFQKKPEFGEASIAAVRVEVEGAEREYLIEPGSTVTRDGAAVEVFQEGVKELLYGADYGRRSE